MPWVSACAASSTISASSSAISASSVPPLCAASGSGVLSPDSIAASAAARVGFRSSPSPAGGTAIVRRPALRAPFWRSLAAGLVQGFVPRLTPLDLTYVKQNMALLTHMGVIGEANAGLSCEAG
eukprot:scaffold23462_cov66-Phaeocystis_antarctica.AAC.8